MNPTLSLASHRPEVHGHRGCRGLFPENTLPAFLHALVLGVDVLELDVVVSQDQQVVVAHDFWLSAQLGTGPAGEAIDPQNERLKLLHDMPYEVIRQCAVGVLPHPKFPQQQLIATYRPLLQEVLQIVEDACQQMQRPLVSYAIELKSTPAGDDVYHPSPTRFVELVIAEIVRAGVQARARILSFDQRVLLEVRHLLPQLPTCMLIEAPVAASQLFEHLGFVPDVLGPDYRLVSQAWLQQVKELYPQLQLVPWTVNTLADLKRAIAWKVTGITTDYPNRLLALLSNNEAE